MEQITIQISNMNDVKREIDNCQRKAMTSVVELGYILRKADDAEIFKEAGYSSIFNFAKEEYGWSHSQTSRFMDINREFSEGGYSTVLRQQYEGFGQAKLAEMLTLPEELREELSPDMKREEIREIKRDAKTAEEENKKNVFANTVLLEGEGKALLQEALELLLLEEKIKKQMPKIYECMEKQAAGQEQSEEYIRLSICGQGFGFTRVAGYMIFWKKEGANILKGTQKESHTYGELIDGLIDLGEPSGKSVEEWYKEVTGKDLYQKKEEKETEVAPAQEKVEKKTLSGIENNIPEEDSELEGQTGIEQFAEEMPIQYEKDEEPEEKMQQENKEVIENVQEEEEEVAPAQEETMEVSQSIETYIPEGHFKEEKNCDCQVCSGKEDIVTNDGDFRLKIAENGLARLEGEGHHAVFEFRFCPACGKEF